MANPQIEDGYLKIANELSEQFARYRISGEEWQIIWVILSKTYGWNKKMDAVSLSQFSELTGIKRSNAIRALNKLVSKKILLSLKNETTSPNLYGFNKNYEEWGVVSKKRPSLKNETKGSLKNDNGVVSKKRHTKDNITKDKYKDNIYPLKNISKEILLEINRVGKEKGIISKELKQDTHILARLREGYSKDDLLKAATNLLNDSWHVQNRKCVDLEYVFRKSKIDAHINMNTGEQSGNFAAMRRKRKEAQDARG